MWFSDTVKTSTYGIKKLNYDEEYLKSCLVGLPDDYEYDIVEVK